MSDYTVIRKALKESIDQGGKTLSFFHMEKKVCW